MMSQEAEKKDASDRPCMYMYAKWVTGAFAESSISSKIYDISCTRKTDSDEL